MLKIDVVDLTPETEGRSLSFSVGCSIQGGVLDVTHSTPQGAPYNTDVSRLLSNRGNKNSVLIEL